MVFVLSRCRCTSAKRTNNGVKKNPPRMVNAPIVQTIHMHAEANRRVKYTVAPFHVETLAVFSPRDKSLHWYFTDTTGVGACLYIGMLSHWYKRHRRLLLPSVIAKSYSKCRGACSCTNKEGWTSSTSFWLVHLTVTDKSFFCYPFFLFTLFFFKWPVCYRLPCRFIWFTDLC